MVYYYDSNGKKYLGKIHSCAICKREKIVRKNKKNELCRKCSYGHRKSDVKDNEVFIESKIGRKQRLRAVKTVCEICHREYLRRAGDKYKTKICNQCICNINGKKSYKNGIGSYVERAIRFYGNHCSICNSQKSIEIHHIDLNRRNNKIENLQVVCRSCHKKIHWKILKENPERLQGYIKSVSGENGPAKLTESEVKEIRQLYPLFSQKELSEMYNMSKGAIAHIVKLRSWKLI